MINLMDAASADMNYVPGKKSHTSYGQWYKGWGDLDITVINGTECFDQTNGSCVQSHNRASHTGNQALVYRYKSTDLDVGKKYMFNAFIKPHYNINDLEHWVDADVAINVCSKTTTANSYNKVVGGWKSFPRDGSWIIANFLFEYTQDDANKVSTYGLDCWDIRVKLQKEIDFTMDGGSLEKIEDSYSNDPNSPNYWRTKAESYIASSRRGTLTIVNAGTSVAYVEVKQNKLGYPFGACSMSKVVAGPPYSSAMFDQAYVDKYRGWFEARNHYLTWHVFNMGPKWKNVQPNEGPTDYGEMDAALDWTNSLGLKVRGHAIHWNKEKTMPKWAVTKDNTTNEFVDTKKKKVPTATLR